MTHVNSIIINTVWTPVVLAIINIILTRLKCWWWWWWWYKQYSINDYWWLHPILCVSLVTYPVFLILSVLCYIVACFGTCKIFMFMFCYVNMRAMLLMFYVFLFDCMFCVLPLNGE